MSLSLYIARHGEDEDNSRGILNGRRNLPLTSKGELQARATAKVLGGSGIAFGSVYASPLLRTMHTAEIIARGIGGPRPEIIQDLIERDFGIMTGRHSSEIASFCSPDLLVTERICYFLKPAGGETFPQLLERCRRVLSFVLASHTEGNVLLVTHGDVGMMLYAAYYEKPWEEILSLFHFGNCEVLLLSPHSPAEQSHFH